ncbi:MAG: glycosyltransferase family 39 protein [Bacteroidales bacterium]
MMGRKTKKIIVNNYWIVTAIFIVVKLSLHFATAERYELLRDEMLFFNMGKHLDAGYVSVPPLTGLLAFISMKVFGFSVFGIRFFPALAGASSLLIISLIVKELGGKIPALVISCTGYLLAPGFLIVNSLFTPNAIEELIWLLITWLLFLMVRRNRPVLWIPVGLLVAIGFLNKYSVLFVVAAFLIAMVSSRYRYLLASRYFLFSLVTGLVIVFPNLLWQYNHGWPVIRHMTELKSSQLDLLGSLEFPVSLYAFSQGSVFIWIIGLAGLLFSREGKELRFFGFATTLILAILMLLKGKGYYGLGCLPFLLAFGGYLLESRLTRLVFLRNALFLFTSFMSILAIPSGLPVLSYDNYSRYVQATRRYIVHPLLRWDNGTYHDFSQAWSDMTGWEELVGYVKKAYESLGEDERGNCTIFGERNYGYAGAVFFYGYQYNLPEAITFHDSYVFWAPDSISAGPLIYIYRDINGLDSLFSDIKEVGSVENKYFREKGLKVYLCKSPLVDIRAIYKNLASEEKSKYSRRSGSKVL